MNTDTKIARHAALRAWLQTKGISGAAFAAAVGVSYPTAAKWIYTGAPLRAQSREKVLRVFPDCPALEWK